MPNISCIPGVTFQQDLWHYSNTFILKQLCVLCVLCIWNLHWRFKLSKTYIKTYVKSVTFFFAIDYSQQTFTGSELTIETVEKGVKYVLSKKCPYSELFWSVFSCIRNKYGEIQSVSLYSVQIGEHADQNNSKYWHFLRCDVPT